MGFRALGLFVAFFSFSAAQAAKCTYDTPDSFLSRVVAIDSASGPVYRALRDGDTSSLPPPLGLRSKEVVLLFDGGPHSAYTGYVLDILDQHCAKAAFFFSGISALANPEAVRDVARRGHTLAASADLAALPAGDAEAEVEKGFAAIVKSSPGAAVAPFFRAVSGSDRPETLDFLKARGVSLWHADLDSGDTEPGLSPSQLANRTLLRIRELGKGVIQFHDTKKVTVDCLDSILTGLRLSGFKVVQIVPASNFIPAEAILAQLSIKPVAVASSAPRTSRRLLDEAKRRVLVSRRRDQEARRGPRRRENAD